MKIKWLKLLNMVILQWFFIRLARVVDIDSGKQQGWTVIIKVIPLTGWGGPYKYIGKGQ